MNDILLKNNNRAIIKKLANRSFRSNKIRNVIAVIAISLTTFLFTAVLTIGLGSAGTLEYNTAKAMGSQADALVQGLSAEQFKQLKENSIFQKVGCWIPIAHLNNTNRLSTEIDYADQTQLELRFLTPRTGSAPKNANEVLVSANVLEDMKKQVVSPGRKGYENNFVFDGLRYTIGVGGIHSKNDPEIIIPKEDEILVDVDVASLYPSMLIEYSFYPKHLGPEFLEVYKQIKDERIEAKHNGNKVKNETLKLALNGLSGNLQNEHNFCYSPEAVMKIRINGQLLLLMLAEKLTQIQCRIVQANTDGLFVIVKKDKLQRYQQICKDWEQLTKLTLEEDRFEAMYQYAINDYIAIKEGYSQSKDPKLIKTKGMFITEVKLGKGLTPKIIPEAVIKYFADGIPVRDTIYSCKDIKKFLMSEKTGKQWHVEYMNKEQQRTNRFYASTDGGYLWKWKDNEGVKVYQNMLTASGVTILNKFDNKPIEERKINYRYYLSEALKIVEELKPRQLTLF